MGFQVFKILLAIEVLLLFVQFWLGMSINLYVSLPMYTPQDFAGYMGGQEVLAHIVSAIVILVLAGLILSYGSRLESHRVIVFSSVGLSFAIIAALTGATFMFKGQDNSLSMAMAMSFLLAFAVYVSEFFLVDALKK
jgi:peptidoglycan/LPS O-acetylase OafA/YrhL